MEDATGHCGLRGMDIAAELPLSYAVHDRTVKVAVVI